MSADRALLGDGDEQDVVQPRVVAPDRVAGVHAPLAGGLDDLAAAPPDAHAELLEGRLARERELGAGRGQPLLRVLGERHARLAHLAQPLRPEPAQVDEAAEGEERLVGGDVRGRLLAADVLLARRQRQDEAAPALRVGRLADDAAGHPADVLLLARDEAVVRAAVGHRVPGPLPLADRERAAVVARRLEHAERDRIDVRDRQRPGLVRDARPGRAPPRGSRRSSAAGR